MERINNEKRQDFLEYLEMYETSETLEDIIDLIKKISHLMPLNQKNKIELLERIIIYINAIINGDPIQQVIHYEYETHLAKRAINEFVAAIHEE